MVHILIYIYIISSLIVGARLYRLWYNCWSLFCRGGDFRANTAAFLYNHHTLTHWRFCLPLVRWAWTAEASPEWTHQWPGSWRLSVKYTHLPRIKRMFTRRSQSFAGERLRCCKNVHIETVIYNVRTLLQL